MIGVPKMAKPGGALAKARMAAHRDFDLLWKFGHMTRSEAYRWLTYAMEVDPYTTAHMKDFTRAQCAEVQVKVKEYWEEQRDRSTP